MRLLLDTHYLVWLTILADRLTEGELALLDEHEVVASSISFWELRIKWEAVDKLGRRKGPVDPRHVLGMLPVWHIRALPLEPDQACATLVDPIVHKDPFDLQLLVHAQTLGARLLTRDTRLLTHPLAYRPT